MLHTCSCPPHVAYHPTFAQSLPAGPQLPSTLGPHPSPTLHPTYAGPISNFTWPWKPWGWLFPQPNDSDSAARLEVSDPS